VERNISKYAIDYYAGSVRDSVPTQELFMEFCEWATNELAREFPNHSVAAHADLALARIVDIPGGDAAIQVLTDDDAHREQICEYCENLLPRWKAARRIDS
jgi:hypothetical protein